MGFFDDDPFEDILREFFDHSPSERRMRRRTIIKGEEEERNIDFVESEDKAYLVFELPGYSEKEVIVFLKGNELEITAKKENGEGMQSYLNEKLKGGIHFNRILPKFINAKKFNKSMKNGVLEIVFEKIR